MKIESSGTIRISGRSTIISLLNNLKKGSEHPAKIIERPSTKEAILEIAGKRIRAEFPKGVPGNNRLILKLENKQDNTFIFKIVSSTSKDGFIDKLSE